jgi:UDP-2,3-diacylglucosamine pyrophosphatase LpxH
MEKVKTIFLSDLHLGTKACKAELIKIFLTKYEADTYFFIGDIIDILSLKSNWFWPESHNQVLLQILKLSKTSIINYISGNHDALIRNFVPLDFGNITIQNHAMYTTLKNEKLLIIHGDIFDYFVENSKLIWMIGGLIYDGMIYLNDYYHIIANKFDWKEKSFANYIKNNTKIAKKAIQNFEKAAIRYGIQKEYNGIVTGHIHSPNLIKKNNFIYVNTGDWVDSCTALIETLEGELKMVKLNQVI